MTDHTTDLDEVDISPGRRIDPTRTLWSPAVPAERTASLLRHAASQ